VAEAIIQAKLGADIIVAQGTEAGGHGTTESTTFCLVPQVAAALKELEKSVGRPILTVAAGGIVDGHGLAAALSLGADGVLMGTRFFASHESPEPEKSKAAVVAISEGAGTLRTRTWDVLSGGFWPKKYDGRAIRNAASNRHAGRERALEEEYEKDPAKWRETALNYTKQKKAHQFDEAALWAGAGAVKKIDSVENIINQTLSEASSIIKQNHDLLLASKL